MTDLHPDKLVHALVEAARIYEASCRLGGKDQEFASLKLDAARAAAANTIEALQARLDRVTEERNACLVLLYRAAPVTTAKMCDEDLDRSGALLGQIREMSREALNGERM